MVKNPIEQGSQYEGRSASYCDLKGGDLKSGDLKSSDLQGLTRLKKNIASQSQSLEELWLSQPGLWQELNWEQAQLKLWLRCQPDINVESSDPQSIRYQLKTAKADGAANLSEEIAKILQGVGKPMPMAQLKNKLPAGLLVTEPMIKAAINNHPGLTLTGPLVKLNQ